MGNNIYMYIHTIYRVVISITYDYMSDHRCQIYNAYTKVKLTMNNIPATTSGHNVQFL